MINRARSVTGATPQTPGKATNNPASSGNAQQSPGSPSLSSSSQAPPSSQILQSNLSHSVSLNRKTSLMSNPNSEEIDLATLQQQQQQQQQASNLVSVDPALTVVGAVKVGTKGYIETMHKKRKAIMEQCVRGKGSLAQRFQVFRAPNGKWNVNEAIDEGGNTPLHIASMYNDVSLAAYLIQRGANPILPNEAGKSPTDIAVYFKYSNLEKLFSTSVYTQLNCLASATNPTGSPSIDCPPLFELAHPVDPHLSIQLESLEQNCYAGSSLAYITANDPDEGQKSSGKDVVCWTALMKASYRGQVKIATWLVNEQKVNVNVADPKGYTALHWASLNGHIEIVNMLLKNGADVNSCASKTLLYPIHCACFYGYPAVVKSLLEAGAEPNTPSSPVTPLMIASWKGLIAPVTILLANGAKLDPVTAHPRTRGWWKKSLDFLHHGDATKITTQGKYPDDYIDIRCLLDLVSNLENNTKTDKITIERLTGVIKSESYLLGSFPSSMSDSGYSFVLEQRFANCIKGYKRIALDTARQANWLDAIKVSSMGDFGLEMVQIISDLPIRGTAVDVLLLNMIMSVGEMINCWLKSEKHKIAPHSALFSENINQCIKMVEYVISRIETSMDVSQAALSSYERILWCHSATLSSMKEITNNLKLNGHREFVVKTKIALGVWPPPSAFNDLLKLSSSIISDVKKLCHLVNIFGVYEEGYIRIKGLDPSNTVSVSPDDRIKLDYTSYKKSEELQKIHELQLNGDKTNLDSNSNKTSHAQIEEKLYAQIESIVSQVVKAIQSLKQAKDQDKKELYVPAASDVLAKMEMLVDEIRKSDVFYNAEKLVVPINAGITAATGIGENSNEPNTISNILKRGGTEILKKAEDIVHHARLASGVWPPATAVPNMIQATIGCLTSLKAYVNGTKGLMQWIWKNMDDERLNQLQWKRECLQTEVARSLFKVLEKKDFGPDSQTTEADIVASGTSPNIVSEEDESAILEDGNDGLVIEKTDGMEIIKGGKLTKLVERLAHYYYFDPEFQTAFLLTHNSFTTSSNLLDLLLRRYDIFPPFGLTEKQFTRFISKKIIPIKLRIANILKQWIDRHFHDFAYNDALIGTVRVFLEKRLVEDFDSLSLRLIKTLDEKLEGLSKSMNIYAVDRSTPKAILPKQFINPEMGHHGLYDHLKAYHRNIFDLDPLEVARQLTLIDSSLFRKIQAKECLNNAWSSKDKINTAPNISKLVSQTNALTRWVATSLLEVDFVKARLILIRWFCTLLQHLKELNNFNGMTTIVAGLSMGSVARLNETWTAFKDKNGKMYDFMKECQSLVSPKGQYAEYRKAIKVCGFPSLPFLGVYLTDLTFIEDGNPDFLPGVGSYINFEKRRKVAVIIKEIQGFQITPYALQPVPPLMEYLESHSKLDLRVIQEDKDLYALSLKHEKRQE